MTTALLCCRGRWLEGSLPCSFYTVLCHPCSGKRLCRSPSSHTPLSPTPATASRAPASTAWGLQGRRPVSEGCRRAAPSAPDAGQPLSIFLPPPFPLPLSLSLASLLSLPLSFPPHHHLSPHSALPSLLSSTLFLLFPFLSSPLPPLSPSPRTLIRKVGSLLDGPLRTPIGLHGIWCRLNHCPLWGGSQMPHYAS